MKRFIKIKQQVWEIGKIFFEKNLIMVFHAYLFVQYRWWPSDKKKNQYW